MAKKVFSSPVNGFSSGYVIDNYDIQHLEGRLLTLVESLGLRDTQEKAVKDLLRGEVWKLVEPCFIISSEDRTRLAEKYSKERSNALVTLS